MRDDIYIVVVEEIDGELKRVADFPIPEREMPFLPRSGDLMTMNNNWFKVICAVCHTHEEHGPYKEVVVKEISEDVPMFPYATPELMNRDQYFDLRLRQWQEKHRDEIEGLLHECKAAEK